MTTAPTYVAQRNETVGRYVYAINVVCFFQLFNNKNALEDMIDFVQFDVKFYNKKISSKWCALIGRQLQPGRGYYFTNNNYYYNYLNTRNGSGKTTRTWFTCPPNLPFIEAIRTASQGSVLQPKTVPEHRHGSPKRVCNIQMVLIFLFQVCNSWQGSYSRRGSIY